MPDFRTGSHYLHRKPLFNMKEPNLDIPDGDIALGKKLFDFMCLGCHQLEVNNSFGPMLQDALGRRHGVKKFNYSTRMRGSKNNNFRWSKQRLYMFLEQPQEFFPDTNMAFDGISNPYERASIIEYMNLLRRKTPGKPMFYE